MRHWITLREEKGRRKSPSISDGIEWCGLRDSAIQYSSNRNTAFTQQGVRNLGVGRKDEDDHQNEGRKRSHNGTFNANGI